MVPFPAQDVGGRGGFSGPDSAAWVRRQSPNLEAGVVKRSNDPKDFKVQPRRWMAEGTSGWFRLKRRLVRDREKTQSSATTRIYIAMIVLVLNRLVFQRLCHSSAQTLFPPGSVWRGQITVSP